VSTALQRRFDGHEDAGSFASTPCTVAKRAARCTVGTTHWSEQTFERRGVLVPQDDSYLWVEAIAPNDQTKTLSEQRDLLAKTLTLGSGGSDAIAEAP
jgi:hypothetical protein